MSIKDIAKNRYKMVVDSEIMTTMEWLALIGAKVGAATMNALEMCPRLFLAVN